MSEHTNSAEEPRSLADRVLDLVLYAPAGALLSAADDWPALALKGRQRIDQELHNAHLLGRFAVEMGRRQIQSHLDSFFGAEPPRADRPAGGRARAGGGGVSDEAPDGGEGAAPPAPAPGPGTLPVDPVVDRAIPGYDTLSASQVVRRLDGLDPDELAAVESHERRGRGRRTILTRARQLLDRQSLGDQAD